MANVGGDPEKMLHGAAGLRQSAAGFRELRSELHDGGTLAAALGGNVQVAAALDRFLAVMDAEISDIAVQLDLLSRLAQEAGVDLWNATGR